MRCLILPCETRVREFDAKLLLSLICAQRGFPAIVGAKKSIDLSLAAYDPGVYVGKSLTARSRHNLQLARSSGHRLVLWDEEGLVWASREVYWRTKVDGATLNEPERLIAWGEDNAEAWTEHPDYAGTPVLSLGNPRADLLSPRLRRLFDAEVESIRASHGRFVLVNTNFSRVNHVQPRQNRHLKWLREQRPDDPRGGFAAHKYALFQAFCQALPTLARRLPDVRFVIRPHPSEQRRTWEDLASGHANLAVAQHGNVVAWLLASDGLIHNGCTTAVEAYQLGRAALAFRPVRSSQFDHPLPNDISLACDSLEQLIERTSHLAVDPDAAFTEQTRGPAGAIMARALSGLDTATLASERIVLALQDLLEDSVGPVTGSRSRWSAGALVLRRLFRAVEHHVPGTANYRPYLAHMFPDIDRAEVMQRVREMAACLELAPLPEVRELERNVFRLEPARV